MGLEVSWYLRVSRPERIEALVQDKAAGQITNAVAPDQGYDIVVEPVDGQPGFSLVRLTRMR